ncbi:HNH endonuclease signature motif containing protein [Curvibacter sp. RS43]|uniref:HNH endonuclease n=1 Tax=Curvibacter microcysteis TaxID=3026419 RepID=UPI002362A234|nr:HNH endonuclease signature motif containing protein [Curvibacter sp. RS43]MDD0811044.1 HNH endonuclease signature motif containing protein [Curvibacter sp. RS43]
MTKSIDNYQLRAALIQRGFEDITSADRSTKSWKLQHPKMRNWVSIKLAEDTLRPMRTAPLVIHPEDARRVASAVPIAAGVVFQDASYRGNSTKYAGGMPGRALSLANESAVDAFVAAALIEADDSPAIDPLIWAAAASDVDAGLGGRVVTATTRKALIEARVGQGRYRKDLMEIWHRRCAVTGCGIEKALVASHVVPWRESKDPETCLDPYNGLLLAASIDKLFDQGLISFDEAGRLLRCTALRGVDLLALGITTDARLRSLSPKHQPYLAAHRAKHNFNS